MRTLTPRFLVNEGRPYQRYRFGPFEFDPRAGELRKHGTRIRVRQQPLEILHMLLESPGEVVLRDEICRLALAAQNSGRIRPQHQRIDSGPPPGSGRLCRESPLYRDLPRRGYRFIGTVEVVPPAHPGPRPCWN